MATAPLIAHLAHPDGDPEGVAALQAAFRGINPGYDVVSHRACRALAATQASRVVFVVTGGAVVDVGAGSSPVEVGDVILMRAGERWQADADVNLVAFTVPEPLPDELPTFLRPDHDPLLTDTPGGCADEADAYRRIVLTWLRDVGPYTFRALNAHRVRMWDSFSHYHPPEGGFDELYLVQEIRPGAHVIVSTRREEIERPESVTAESVNGLLQRLEPEPGDLVMIPRGVIHRGVGGVLAHVITVPGFKPGFEIGVDHHLRSINERLGLPADERLPFQQTASDAPLVK
ncbi:MAG: hypothetical protein CMJ83_08880 [Planctomycetes bacterium]|nr:hypothetical protein [Planctomycetota bacterium]